METEDANCTAEKALARRRLKEKLLTEERHLNATGNEPIPHKSNRFADQYAPAHHGVLGY